MSNRPHETTIERFERVCREQGLLVTAYRRDVIKALLGRENYPTVDQVYAEIRARFPGISRTSVCRVLEILVATGMVTSMWHHEAAARFDAKVHQHHHLVCLSCERIIDVEDRGSISCPYPMFADADFRSKTPTFTFEGGVPIICGNRRLGSV